MNKLILQATTSTPLLMAIHILPMAPPTQQMAPPTQQMAPPTLQMGMATQQMDMVINTKICILSNEPGLVLVSYITQSWVFQIFKG